VIGAPPQGPFDESIDKSIELSNKPAKKWFQWMQAAFRTLKKDHGTGTTAQRPVNIIDVGHQYFDTTLGHMVWYDGSGWVDGSGNSV